MMLTITVNQSIIVHINLTITINHSIIVHMMSTITIKHSIIVHINYFVNSFIVYKSLGFDLGFYYPTMQCYIGWFHF